MAVNAPEITVEMLLDPTPVTLLVNSYFRNPGGSDQTPIEFARMIATNPVTIDGSGPILVKRVATGEILTDFAPFTISFEEFNGDRYLTLSTGDVLNVSAGMRTIAGAVYKTIVARLS